MVPGRQKLDTSDGHQPALPRYPKDVVAAMTALPSLPAPTFSLDALFGSPGPAPTGQRAAVPRRPNRPVRAAATPQHTIRPTNIRAIQGALRALVHEGHIPGAVGLRQIVQYSGVSIGTVHAAVRQGIAATVGLVYDDLAPMDRDDAWEWKITDSRLARADAGECAPYWWDHGQTARAIWETLDAQGPMKVKHIAEAVDMSVPTVRATNAVLSGLGAIERVGHGTYAAVGGWCPWAQTPETVTRSISDGIDRWEYTGTRAECAAEQHRADRIRVGERWDENVARLSADRLEREAQESVRWANVERARGLDLIDRTTRDAAIDETGLRPRHGPPLPSDLRLTMLFGAITMPDETDAERCVCGIEGRVYADHPACAVHEPFSF